MSERRAAGGTDRALAEQLACGARELGLILESDQVDAFVAYLRLIERWSATYNLTAIRDPERMVTHHLLDCLAAAAALLRHRERSTMKRILDVGSGAGLPGLVLAVVLPESEIVCVDSVGKKTAFITQAAAVLQIKNAIALQARVETLESRLYDVIASRAFASLHDFVGATRHLLADNGEWMALKARAPRDTIGALEGVHCSVEPIDIPGLGAERCIVWIVPKIG